MVLVDVSGVGGGGWVPPLNNPDPGSSRLSTLDEV